ncbi:hypothetical protein NW768_010678 [Fusarium equiseti]|uniref:Uncharacterized protein n=1 Tax=Fusarium equiseti TaxID=61235 RepID=A0ABQ8QZZ4_FUSEQ|nr:hypothetical protein NW768_010678 [Fusarium equiseti]
MSSNAENEKASKVPTSTPFAPPTRPMAKVKADKDDDWEIVNEKDSQAPTQSEAQAKNEGDLEKGTEEPEKKTEDERRRELMKEKWADMRQQQGGVHPDREVKIPTYKSFVGDW